MFQNQVFLKLAYTWPGMRTLIYFSRQLPGLSDDLERAGFHVFEALAISEVFYLSEQHPSAQIVIDSSVEDSAALQVAQHQPTMRLKRGATAGYVVLELSQVSDERIQ